MNDFTKQQKLEKAHEDNGCCGSCGWHASFHEMNYEFDRIESDGRHRYWDSCKSKDSENSIDHRCCYIYLDMNHE
ncbi:TPA: hypothetical protein ACPSKZ_000699 [Legionella anisa]|uniref:hypothetical protein n=1 Tax=Legionella anisa TaxID=28082 RepID=UPI00224301EA|nr:hypothetical protein [Legionella anisa]MCW8425603.1 hypothetical protein [Legionella anisa]